MKRWGVAFKVALFALLGCISGFAYADLLSGVVAVAGHWPVGVSLGADYLNGDSSWALGFVGAVALGNGQLTLADVSKRTSPDGKIDPLAELLSQRNDILEDIVFVEANQATSHVVSQRTGLPVVYFRRYNQGVPPSKSTSSQISEPIAMLEGRSHIDAKLAKLNGNTAELRLSEATPFIESMVQQMTQTVFNGNVGVNNATFSGLSTRYSTSPANPTPAGNAGNVILAGGNSTNNASIYLVVWGKETVFCTFPKGSTAGLTTNDLGEESVPDGNGGWYQAIRTLFQWDCGFVTKDWRYVVRIANINIADWIGVQNTQALTAATNVTNLMLKAIARIPNMRMGRPCFYANRTIAEGLMIQAKQMSSAYLGIQKAATQFGDEMLELNFLGIPVRIVDQLGVAESLVV
ncbi:major capsid protein [Methylomonas sp. AM2-LC]|uniref:major capsid protein n=1 Tax=Methylomonas sp. AM2-LC TaxID=3153301 RepID=UPI0032655A36